MTTQESADFRLRLAPSPIHIFESPQLTNQLLLSEKQSEQISEIVNGFKETYLKRETEIASLPKDSKERRGWPPTRDRKLIESIEEIIEPEQSQTYRKLLLLWRVFADCFSSDATFCG
jgi:hypothetical protein